nr:dna topoisomerase 2 [Quercus suber]
MEDVRMQGNVVNNESLNVKRILLLLKRNFKTFYCSAKAFKAIPIRPVFSNNMGTKSEPVISKCKESENWTKVSFQPDLAKFNMTHLKDDVVALLEKWVFDLAGCLRKSVKVLNGTQFPIKSSRDYVNLYLDSAAKSKPDKPPSYHVKVNDRWEICVSLSHRQFQQSKDLKKSDGTKTEKIHGRENVDDANKIGGKESDKCTLILTEGDSAEALAGLGTSTSKEGREYFANLEKHREDFIWEDEQDGEAIELAFSTRECGIDSNTPLFWFCYVDGLQKI